MDGRLWRLLRQKLFGLRLLILDNLESVIAEGFFLVIGDLIGDVLEGDPGRFGVLGGADRAYFGVLGGADRAHLGVLGGADRARRLALAFWADGMLNSIAKMQCC